MALWAKPLVLNLGLLRSFGLQLPEAFTTSCPDWGFWESQFKNTCVTKVKNHWVSLSEKWKVPTAHLEKEPKPSILVELLYADSIVPQMI